MTDSNANDETVSDAALRRAGVFGIDSEGNKHTFDPVRAQVIVRDGDDIVHVEQLARERVPEWIEFVGENRGWNGVWWSEENLHDAVEAHKQAKEGADL
jgi:hypothetical protein